MKKNGFTLAEVLVTLGIIGVVSAMTVPTLMQNYQRKSYITQLHKVYNEVQQASINYMNQRNALNLTEAGLTSQDAVNEFMTLQFKSVNKCAKASDCFASLSEYKKLNGTTVTLSVSDTDSFILASGVAVRPLYMGNGNIVVNVLVDINGKSGPNILGRDLFMLCLYKNGVIDEYSEGTMPPISKEDREKYYNNCDTGTGTYGCFGRILNDNWEMTY